MKKIASLLFISLLAFSACEKTEPEKPALKITPEHLQIGASDQIVSRELTVEALGEWEITSVPDWVTTKAVTAEGFSIDIEPFLDGETESREGEIVVAMGETTAKATITQLTYLIPYVLEVDTDRIENVLDGVEYTITVEASHAWEVDTETDWVTISNETETGFVLTVAPYGDEQAESREGTVVVSSRDSDHEITLIQLKPVPDAIPLADYLGEYTITGTMLNLSVFGDPAIDGRAYTSIGTMVLRPDMGENWVSIEVLGVDENYGESAELFFTYDPTTGTLFNNNYTPTTTTCTFSYYTISNGFKSFYAIEEGTLSFNLTDGSLPIPAKYTVEDEEKDLCICQFYPLSHLTWSMIAIDNIAMNKNN